MKEELSSGVTVHLIDAMRFVETKSLVCAPLSESDDVDLRRDALMKDKTPLNEFGACNPNNEGFPYSFINRRHSVNNIGGKRYHGASIKFNSFSLRFISKVQLKFPPL